MKVVSMRETTLFVVTLCFVFGVNKGDFELTILHTNDVHARFEEFSEVSELPLCNKKCRSLRNLLHQARKKLWLEAWMLEKFRKIQNNKVTLPNNCYQSVTFNSKYWLEDLYVFVIFSKWRDIFYSPYQKFIHEKFNFVVAGWGGRGIKGTAQGCQTPSPFPWSRAWKMELLMTWRACYGKDVLNQGVPHFSIAGARNNSGFALFSWRTLRYEKITCHQM